MEVHVLDPIMEVFMFETSQQIEQLELLVLEAETSGRFSSEVINDIFRNMHTMKSSAAMMEFHHISTIAHATEDLFFFIRESDSDQIDYSSLCDIVLESIDFIKLELEKLRNGDIPDGDASTLIDQIKHYLAKLKQQNQTEAIEEVTASIFRVVIHFQEGCEMENIRAYMIIQNLEEIAEEFHYLPKDILESNETSEIIQKDGFTILFKTNKTLSEMEEFFQKAAHVERFELKLVERSEDFVNLITNNDEHSDACKVDQEKSPARNHQPKIISVNVEKLDKLLDLVGEMVISEAMVTQNPDLRGLPLENFQKAARQLRKITNEIQDTVMSIRMVPLGATFHKMNRIVRDMCKKLNKEVNLEIIGEETEVDKNIIDHLGDPLMHLVRNAIDHGIEPADERESKGKTRAGTLTLEAKNVGNEVLVFIKDDGRGLNKEKILDKASRNGLLKVPSHEMTDKEIYNLIFLPGFSTKEGVTEFSGRGVGMDVVSTNIESIGGTIHIDSINGQGTTITIRIPLTLAIIDGMNIRVGKSKFTLPTTSIIESFSVKENEVFEDPDGNEMIMIRGNCYPILRLHHYYQVPTNVQDVHEGIMIMVESGEHTLCLFVDELLEKQQVVVKELPDYIRKVKKITGITGCTLLGDGSISLILDINGLVNEFK